MSFAPQQDVVVTCRAEVGLLPDGWLQFIRGPRPPAQRWPPAKGRVQQSEQGMGQGKGQVLSRVPTGRWRSRQFGFPQSNQGPTPPPLRQVSKPPEKVAADAIGEIQRLQAAIAALGDSTALVKPLQEALPVAQARASVPPSQERVDSCKLFLERAKKREVIDRACEQKALYEAEVVEGEGKVGQARERGSEHPGTPSCFSAGLRTSGKNRCSGFGARCVAFCFVCPDCRRSSRNWDSVWSSLFRHSPAGSSPEAGVSSGRFHPSLRRGNARVDGGPTQEFASRVGCWTATRSCEGFAPLDAGSAGMATNDPRPVHEYAICSGQFSEVIRQQCGMVGVRVGEAANPGPPGSVDEELLDCLQRDLSRRVPRRVRRRVMDSDSDVPLLHVDSDADRSPRMSAAWVGRFTALAAPPAGFD